MLGSVAYADPRIIVVFIHINSQSNYPSGNIMPIYEYQCTQCHTVFEEWLSINSATETEPCPECKGEAHRIISNTTFVLKGGGWYTTEYGNRKNDSAQASSSTSSTPSASSKSEASSPVPTTNTTNSTAPQSASAASA